ncbi:MAG: hypothetical protein IKR63_06145 [Alloprevotella sp.]|nr:hypothetical protein [Alloprevotella sp.]
MKKKGIMMVAIIMVAISAFAAVNGGWIKVKDSCDNCSITSYSYKCGKCNSGMSFSTKWDNKQIYLVYTFTCRKCHHQCIYKIKAG